mgnify:CR=1 FL=1
MKEILGKLIDKKKNEAEKIKEIVGNIEEKFNEAEAEEEATKQAVEEALRKLEEKPKLAEAVLRELLVRQNISDSVPVETIKNIPESEIPNDKVVEVVEKLSDELPDNKMLEIAEETTLGLKGKQKIVEAVSDPDKKRKKHEELIVNELNKIYKELNKDIGEFRIKEEIGRILQVMPKMESEKIQKIINQILAKRIVLNYMNFNSTMPRKFSGIKSIEEMFEENFPQIAETEYKKMARIDREEARYKFKESKFKENLLKEIAKNVAESYKKNGYKRLVIPQSEEMKQISQEEEEKFIQEIAQAVKAKGGKLDAISELDAKGQIRGNIEETEKIEDYVSKIGELPQNIKIEFIEQGKKIITDQDLLNISNYCNKVGLYQSLAELGQTQAEKVVDSFIEIIEKRKQMKENKSKKIAPKEEIPKVKAAKFIDER